MDHSDLTGGFTAKLGNSKLLMQVLKAIHYKDDATISITSNGLKVTIEDAKSFQVWTDQKISSIVKANERVWTHELFYGEAQWRLYFFDS